MSERLAIHSQFTIERTLPYAPSRVFAAYADGKLKARWFVGPDGWTQNERTFDFRVGGIESVAGGPPGGSVHRYEARYCDIVKDQRIVSTYQMWEDDRPMSVSLATVVLVPHGKGTKLIYTEQLVYIDGKDWGDSREVGTKDLLDKLEASLRAS